MPSIPAEFISFSFDTSLVGGFLSGFGELFSNIPNLVMMLFSLVFVTFFDTTGTLLGIANQAGYIDEKGEIEGIEKAFLVDALSGVIGSICGTSTLTAYVESATGVGSGGRTGLAAIVTGILFLLSVFFAPIVLALFTSTVTAAALVMVGVLMIMQLKDVQWDSLVVAASVFMTIIMMVLTYSISLGIAWGFVTYTVATIATGKYKEISWGIWVLAIVFFLYLFFGL
jgi:AGZA family xanthine/uracil permease-like MFS transporter